MFDTACLSGLEVGFLFGERGGKRRLQKVHDRFDTMRNVHKETVESNEGRGTGKTGAVSLDAVAVTPPV